MPDFAPAPQQLNYVPRLDRIRRPDNPKQWAYELIARTAVDRTQPRSNERFAPPIKDQGAEGSCTAHGGTTAAESCAAMAGVPMPVLPLSRSELYWDDRTDLGGQYAPPADNGATVADSIQSQVKRGGLVAESVWPYDAKPAETPPAAVATSPRYLYVAGHQPINLSDQGAAIDAILTAMGNRQAFVFGFDFYQEFYQQFQTTGALSAAPAGQPIGGHEVGGPGIYVPPTAAKPETGRLGLLGLDNSWGLTSPERKDLHPEARAGMIWFPLEALGSYLNEGHAVVGYSSPAILTLKITGPSALGAGQPGAFSASVIGAPAGTQVNFNWAFGLVAETGANVSFSFRDAGIFTVVCVATVATTGASARASMTVNVSAAPSPPKPTPSTKQQALAICDRTIADAKQRIPSNPLFYGTGVRFLEYQRSELAAGLS